MPIDKELQQAFHHCYKMIRKGSKSFSLSALVFNKQTRLAAYAVYGWCRTCDDAIDKPGSKQEHVQKLIDDTKAAYAGEKMTDPVFQAFQHVVKHFDIPIEYPLELLEGMAMDVRGEKYPTINTLLLYCYRVAGTVGLMMTHVMGINNERALLHAASLGKAMQLTNIARDVMDDADLGRVYLPEDWMKELDLNPKEIKNPENRQKVAALVKRLLAVAAVLYQSGDQGLKHLPFREACAIASARLVYSEIGYRVQKKKEAAWDQRVFVPLGRKMVLVFRGVLKMVLSLPVRVLVPWRRIPIRTIWRNTA